MPTMNRLVHETSPYLLQHAHNPVDWYPWGEEALQKAREKDLPILISIGYAACHWCHVMERESFEDEETARLMNENFINIKIDREERPDLDHIYMDAVQAITGSGGWPLNVFLTPEGKPFYGGTYFPPRAVHNRPSWKDLLAAIARSFREKRKEIEDQAHSLTQHIASSGDFMSSGAIPGGGQFSGQEPSGQGPFTTGNLRKVYDGLMNAADRIRGGFGQAPKFPQTFSIRFLLHYHYFTKDKDALEQACLSLDQMIAGGIYDQIGGGFARYSTDAGWLAPHFEKMLYDNALLVIALSEAWQLTRRDHYRDAIIQTMEFVRRELSLELPVGSSSPAGCLAFYSALDADSEGEEGKYYVWDKQEIEAILGEDASLFCRYYGVTEKGNWEGKNILTRPSSALRRDAGRPFVSGDIPSTAGGTPSTAGDLLSTAGGAPATAGDLSSTAGGTPATATSDLTASATGDPMVSATAGPTAQTGYPPMDILPEIDRERLRKATDKLLAHRSRRIRPLLDDKSLLGWNALMTIACAKAYAALGDPEYKNRAIANMNFCRTWLRNRDKEEGEPLYFYYHSYKEGRAGIPAFLDDYATLTAALIELQEITGDSDYLIEAEEIMQFVLQHFSEKATGFFYYTHDQQQDVIVRKKEIYDGALPSGNALMAWNLTYMSVIFDRPEWKERAVRMASALETPVIRYPGSFGVWATLYQAFAYEIPEIVITGLQPEPTRKEFLQHLVPYRVFQSSASENTRFPLLRGRPSEGVPLLFLCKNYSCQMPVNEVVTLIRLLENVQKFPHENVQ